MTEKEFNSSSKHKVVDFKVSKDSHVVEKRHSALLKNVHDNIITEMDEDMVSKSSRRQSVGLDANENIDAYFDEAEQFASPDPALDVRFKKNEQVEKPHLDSKLQALKEPKESFLPLLPSANDDPFDISNLLKRNEELMRLIGDDVGDFSDIDPPALQTAKSAKILRNNLSQKYMTEKQAQQNGKEDQKLPSDFNLSDVNTLLEVNAVLQRGLKNLPQMVTNNPLSRCVEDPTSRETGSGRSNANYF